MLFCVIETSEMKVAGVGAPLATAALLPSPVLLWRLKVVCSFSVVGFRSYVLDVRFLYEIVIITF